MFLDSIRSANVRLRMRAAIFLSLEGNKSIKNTVIESLKDPDAYVRKLALEALGNLKDIGMIPTFKDLLIDSSPEVRNAARFAIKKVEYANIAGHAANNLPKIDFLRYAFVNDATREVKVWAGKELLALGKSGVLALEEISAKEEYGEIALLAAKILDINDK
ncbi:HEAT repeat domain-containing protein [Candidatus Poribacteria bacterium]|nr:HEAT repeat domain-containing protein [Candidatus Poribacteria bacterium]